MGNTEWMGMAGTGTGNPFGSGKALGFDYHLFPRKSGKVFMDYFGN